MFEPNDLRDVLVVARARSLGEGARRLGIDASTMGRRLAALERKVGFALFLRSRTGLRLTAQGTKVAEAAEAVEARQIALEHELRGEDAALRGPLRISVAEWGAPLLTPALAELAGSAPLLALTLLVENRNVDLARGEADIALRVGRPTEQALVARPLGSIRYRAYGSGDYLGRRGTPSREAELDDHHFCELALPSRKLPHLRWQARLIRRRRVVLRTNSMLALIEATKSSAGLAVLPVALAQRYPELRSVLGEAAEVHNTLWMVFHESLRGSGPIRAIEPIATRIARLLRG
jgi:DNA-binding transcriptional LysR family regulator